MTQLFQIIKLLLHGVRFPSIFVVYFLFSDFEYRSTSCSDNIGYYWHVSSDSFSRDTAYNYCKNKDSSFLPTVTNNCKMKVIFDKLDPGGGTDALWIGLKDK